MTLLRCFGPRCERMISAWRPGPPNPVAVKDPEHFAVRYSVCEHCAEYFCDRCAPARGLLGRRPPCRDCLGRLLDGRHWEEVNTRPVPQDVEYYREAQAFAEDGDHIGAEGLAGAAVRLAPGYVAALHLRGRALDAIGEPGEAVADYLRVLELAPDRHETHLDLGLAYEALGRADDALAEYRLMIAAAPDFPVAYTSAAAVLRDLGRAREALEAAEAAIGAHAGDGRYDHLAWYAHQVRGEALLALYDHEGALAAIDTAIDKGADNPEAHHVRGTALALLGRYDEARLAFAMRDQAGGG